MKYCDVEFWIFVYFVLLDFMYLTRVERAGSHRDKARFNKACKILMRSLLSGGLQSG